MTDDPSATARFAVDLMPFCAELGVRDVEGSPEGVSATADWAAERCTIGGSLHGGYFMALADGIGAAAAAYHLPEGAGTSTIESKTNFLRGVTEGEVSIRSTVVNAGRRVIVVQTDIHRADGKLATRTTQTQIVLT
ncbi:MAG: aromatic compound degradation protein PaaI [Acidimicrobiales bacterium]|nr:MAG: aromatic compound degradation protein PaaI [Acidimicrobiales bacterium]